ncbi:MAG: phosphoribosylamine--glycine ligase [bacterium]|nr:phosphoribosylamine--glycine ligase [bacterium]
MRRRILILGSGGREAALAWKFHREQCQVYIAPGNGGTDRWATCVPIALEGCATSKDYFYAIANFALQFHIDLIIIGPEKLLEMGIVDSLVAYGLRVFGPTQAAAAIECSKADGKDIAGVRGIQTAGYRVFTNPGEAFAYVEVAQMPVVIKTEDPRSGERTRIVRTVSEATAALRFFMLQGNAGSSVIIEQVIEDGEELSAHAVADGDGKSAVHFPVAQDHSQLIPGGPFTGGVGAIVPVPWVGREHRAAIHQTTVETLAELHERGRPFRGLLYPQFKGPYLLEYNARFGDPETQAYMRLLESSLYNLTFASAEGDLASTDEVRWRPGYAASIAAVSGGYGRHGGKPQYRFPIMGIEEAEQVPSVIVFPAGVRRGERGELLTDGNRVLHVTAIGKTLEQALARAYEGVSCIHFTNMDFSRTIGQSALMLQSAQERQHIRNNPL